MARADLLAIAEQDEQRHAKERRARLVALAQELGVRLPARVEVFGMLTDHVERKVREELSRAWQASKIIIRMNSPGGLARVGRSIAKDLEDLDRLGVPAESHTAGLVASAAVSIFAACGRRRCAATARFVLHNSSALGGFTGWSAGRLRKLAQAIESRDEEELAWLVSRGVSLAPRLLAEIKAGKDVALNARAAFAAGLVHQVEGEIPAVEASVGDRLFDGAPPAARAAYRAANDRAAGGTS
jgi:ATP-dependent protease ClpP protease subunit